MPKPQKILELAAFASVLAGAALLVWDAQSRLGSFVLAAGLLGLLAIAIGRWWDSK